MNRVLHKRNAARRTPMSFLLRAALAFLITAAVLPGSVSAAWADVKIVVAGDANAMSLYAVARYSSDGSLDTSFDTDGKVTTDVNTSEYGFGVATQDDGKIVVVGSVWYTATERDWIVIRYNPDGSLDTATFNPTGAFGGLPNNPGMVTIDFATDTDEAQAVAIQADGKIVVAGYVDTDPAGIIDNDFGVVRLNTDGSLDTSFSGDGKVTTEFGTDDVAKANGVAIQDDGKIVVVGFTNTFGTMDFAVARYNTNGTLDTSFSGDGKVVTDFQIDWDNAYDVAIQDDGKIVVSGYATTGNQNWGIARYNSNGSLDTSFGTGPTLGLVVTDMGSTSEIGRSVAIQADGKIVVGGNSGQDFAVARYNTNGTLDTSFSGDGKVVTDIGSGSNDSGYGLAIQDDGKIVVGGSSASDFAVVRYNSDGSLDTSFDTDGKLTTDFAGSTDIGRALALQTLGEGLSVSTTSSTITVESSQVKMVFDQAAGAGMDQLYGKTESNSSTGRRGDEARYNLWSTQINDGTWHFEQDGTGTLTLLESSPARVKIRQQYDYTSSIHLDRIWTIYPSNKVAIEEGLTFDSNQGIRGVTGIHANATDFFTAGISNETDKVWLVTDNAASYSDILGIPYTQPLFGRDSSSAWETSSETGTPNTYYARVREQTAVSTGPGSDTRPYLLYPYLAGLTSTGTEWQPYARDYRNPSPLDTFNSGSGGWFDASENTSSGSGGSWWNQSWSRRRKITFDNSQPQNLINFPVLIKLDSSRIDYANTKDLGEDIRFVDDDGSTVLPHEIEKWDEAGASWVWVKVPQIDGSSNTDSIWMYYGNDSAADGQNPSVVWSNGYAGVWHLHDDFLDSTGNANNTGTNFGSEDIPSDIAADAQHFTASENDYINFGNDTSLDLTSTGTISAWVKFDSNPTTYAYIVGKSKGGNADTTCYGISKDPSGRFQLWISDNSIQQLRQTSTSTWTLGAWYHFVGVWSGSNLQMYVNGQPDGGSTTQTINAQVDSTQDVHIGCGFDTGCYDTSEIDGTIDEVRISTAPRSGGWIFAQYKSMTDAFATYGAEEWYPGHDFFNEAEGAYAIDMADTQSLAFDIHGMQYERYSPAFKIRNYRSLDNPSAVYRDGSLLKEGTHYVVSLIPFSEAWYSQPFWYPGYAYRRQLTIGSASSGYSIRVSLTGIEASDIYGKCLGSGNDLRVVWWDGSQWNDLDRELESFTSSTITVWFRIQEPGGWGGGDSNYYLYYGNSSPAAVKADKSKVYDLWDDFTDTANWTPFTEQGMSDPTPTAFVDGESVPIPANEWTTLATLSTSFPAGNNFVIAVVQVENAGIQGLTIAAGNLYLERVGGPTLMSNQYQINTSTTGPDTRKWYVLTGLDTGAGLNPSYAVKTVVTLAGISGEAKILAINGVTGEQAQAAPIAIQTTETTLTTLSTSLPAGDNVVLAIFESENTSSSSAEQLINARLKTGGATLAENEYSLYHSTSGELPSKQLHFIPYLHSGAPANPTYTATGISSNKKVLGCAKIVAFSITSMTTDLSAAYNDGSSTSIGTSETVINTLSTSFGLDSEVVVIASEQFAAQVGIGREIPSTLNKLRNDQTGDQAVNQYTMPFPGQNFRDHGKGFGLLKKFTSAPANPQYHVKATAADTGLNGESKILALACPAPSPLPDISTSSGILTVQNGGTSNTVKQGLFHNSFETDNSYGFAIRQRSRKPADVTYYHGVAGWYHTGNQYGPAGPFFYAGETESGRNRYVLSNGTDPELEIDYDTATCSPAAVTWYTYETFVKTDGTMKFTRDGATCFPPGGGYSAANTARTSGKVCLVNEGAGSTHSSEYDWILVRKFTDPEPSVSAGIEETTGGALFGQLAQGGLSSGSSEYLASTSNNRTLTFDSDHYLYLGSTSKFTGVNIDLQQAGAGGTLNWQYWNGAWANLSVSGTPSGAVNFTASGSVHFDQPSNWTKTSVNGGPNLYYVRASLASGSYTTAPVENLMKTDILLFHHLGLITGTTISFMGPTAVDLLSFRATGNGNAVRVSWETAQEINNLGFNLYRSTTKDGSYTKLNSSLIPGLLYSVTGKKYTYDDPNVIKGRLYYYKLEDIDSFGRHKWHGPVCVDWDGDGMPDDWELKHGLDPTKDEGSLDYDNDGLTNYEEYLRGTDPLNPDTDGDGIPDGQDFDNPPAVPGGGGSGDGVKVVSQDETGMVLELKTSGFDSREIEGDGTTYQRLTIPSYTHGLTETTGSPELPVKGYWVDLPGQMDVELSVEKLETETHPGYLVYPVPTKIALEEEVIEQFFLDPEAYGRDRLLPEQRVQKGTLAYFRDQKKAQVLFYPISFNPQAGQLQLHTLIRVRLSFVPAQGAEMQPLGFGTSRFGLAAADPSWPPPYDKLYRISTTEEGIYRIGADELQAAGMDLGSINPQNLHLYGRGTEVAISVFGEEDGSLDPGDDYILFYAEAIDTKYTRANVYWLVAEQGPGLRMNTIDGTPQGGQTPQGFTARLHHEPEQFYWGLAPGADDLDRWFSSQLIWGGKSVDIPLPVREPASAGQTQLQIRLWGFFEPEEHRISATIGGQTVGQARWKGSQPITITGTVDQALLSNWTLRIQSTGSPLDLVLVDWCELTYQAHLAATDNWLRLSSDPEYLTEFQITGFTEADLLVFDITDPLDVGKIEGFELTGPPYALTFHDESAQAEERAYIALGPLQLKTVQGITQVAPPNLTDTRHGADYIVITHRDIGWDAQGNPYGWLRDLLEYRQSQGLRVMAVGTNEIYDQFNYGISDPQAIKDFLGYAYANWSRPAPQYVVLVGDATYDPKGNLLAPGPGVPTYLGWTRYMGETAIDDWFAQISGTDALPDLYLGRLPASDKDQAQIMIGKIISYEEAPRGQPWQKRLLLVSDDQEPIFEQMNESVAALVPMDYSLSKGYLAQYKIAPKTPQDLTNRIIDEINQGVLMVNYVGHGSTQHWAHERIFYTKDDIPKLSNDQRLPVMVLMTCLNGYFVLPQRCLGEEMLLANGAGAVAAFASTGMTDAQVQRLLDQGFIETTFQGGITRLGQAAHGAKQVLLANSTDQEDTANSFSLMGDPAMTLGVESSSTSPAPVAVGAGGGGGGGGGCFIASAAYGSFLDGHVGALRSFRDRVLAKNFIGQSLIQSYYAASPSAAAWIRGHENIRALTRIALVPIVAIAGLELNRTLVICFTLLLLASPLAWTHWLAKRKRRSER